MKSRLVFFIALLWVLPWLACNLPFPEGKSRGLDGDGLRQTMQADTSAEVPSPNIDNAGTTVVATMTTPGKILGTPEPWQVVPPPVATSDLPGYYAYTTQSGDTLPAVAARFSVDPEQIVSVSEIPSQRFILPGQVLHIPWEQDELLTTGMLLPDGEVIYSPTAVGFDLSDFIQDAGGYLSVYTETLDGEIVSGVEIVQRIASQSSINPRLLLAFLEYRSNWVYGGPENREKVDYPIGFYAPGRRGLYQELLMTATQLNVGYYGWRQGSLLTLKFPDQKIARLNPALNPGSVALQHLFSIFYRQDDWQSVLYAAEGFLAFYQQMFGDPWAREAAAGPVIPPDFSQPEMELPFLVGERWSLTGGPHPAWDSGTPRGALDFSPVTGEAICAVSSRWATAVAPGVIARAARNAVALDLDRDGYEQTGWVVVYYHLADSELISVGSLAAQDELLGHPSCEGGRATGKHLHIARKYNGEWLPADGPIPMILSGWQTIADSRNYQGSLINGERVVTSNPGGNQTSVITR